MTFRYDVMLKLPPEFCELIAVTVVVVANGLSEFGQVIELTANVGAFDEAALSGLMQLSTAKEPLPVFPLPLPAS